MKREVCLVFITSHGEEGAGLCASVLVCFVRGSFSHFSRPLGVGGWLRFVIVALSGLLTFLEYRDHTCFFMH